MNHMNLSNSEPIETVPRATGSYIGRTRGRNTLVDSLTTLNRPYESSQEPSNSVGEAAFPMVLPVSPPVSLPDDHFSESQECPNRPYSSNGPTSTRALRESGLLIESEGVPDGVRAPELDQNAREVPARQADILLVDMDPEQMGNLVAVQNSISFIPSKFIRRLRLLWIKYLQRALDSDDIMDWKKYFLLPVILFDAGAAASSSDLKKNMSQRISLLEVDNWDSFTFFSLSIRKDNVAQQTGSEAKLYALAKKYAKEGELSKALKVLLRSKSDDIQIEGTLEKLRSKFPAPNPSGEG